MKQTNTHIIFIIGFLLLFVFDIVTRNSNPLITITRDLTYLGLIIIWFSTYKSGALLVSFILFIAAFNLELFLIQGGIEFDIVLSSISLGLRNVGGLLIISILLNFTKPKFLKKAIRKSYGIFIINISIAVTLITQSIIYLK